MIAAYEGRISGLEREKLILAEKAENPGQSVKSYEEMLELCLRFLSSPWKIWTSGEFEMRRLVLKLAFSEPLVYVRDEGFGTPKTTLPFKVLADFCGSKSKMVPLDEKTSNKLFEVFDDWNQQLKHIDFGALDLDDEEPQP